MLGRVEKILILLVAVASSTTCSHQRDQTQGVQSAQDVTVTALEDALKIERDRNRSLEVALNTEQERNRSLEQRLAILQSAVESRSKSEVTHPSPALPVASASPSPSGSAVGKDELAPAHRLEPPVAAESYWRQRASDIEARIQNARAQFRSAGGMQQGNATMPMSNANYAQAKAEYEAGVAACESFQEEARRADVPPGWVRVGCR